MKDKRSKTALYKFKKGKMMKRYHYTVNSVTQKITFDKATFKTFSVYISNQKALQIKRY